MCYSYADHGGDQLSGHSTTGMICLYSGSISWKSQKQTSVAISTTEAEVVAASDTAQEIIWLKRLMSELTQLEGLPILYVDNESDIKLSYNPPYEFHRRTKHIHIRHFYVRECISNGDLVVRQVASQDQLGDMFNYINH